jgi:putative inorganic carbon (hco3(-)) transporter
VKGNKVDFSLTVLLLPLLIAAGFFIAQKFFMGALLAMLALLLISSWLISKFKLQSLFFMLLALLLPFSFEVSVNENLNLNIPTEPMLAVAVFSIGWDILKQPRLIKQLFGNESRWILPFMACFVLTTFFSTIVWVSVKFSIVNLTYILTFFIWQKHLFKNHPNLFPKLLGLYSLSLFAVIVYALYKFDQYGWSPATIRGIFSPFYKDNTIFGATAAILASFWLAYIQKAQLSSAKIIYLLTGIFFLAGVVLSNSRAALLSLVFFGIIWLFVQLRIRLKHIAIGFVVMLVLLRGFHGQALHMLRENRYLSHDPKSSYVEQIESSGNISSDISNIERLNRWVSGLGMFAEKPITGFGPGTYQFAYIPYQKPEFMNRLTVADPWHIPENSGGTAHSEYILALSEMGILGIFSLLLFLGRLGFIVFEKARKHPQRIIIIIAFSAMSTYVFHAFFNNFLSTDKFAFLFWGCAAWMMSQFELKTNGKQRVL